MTLMMSHHSLSPCHKGEEAVACDSHHVNKQRIENERLNAVVEMVGMWSPLNNLYGEEGEERTWRRESWRSGF